MSDALKKMLIELITSKKALAAVAGLLIATAGKWGFTIPEETVNQLLAMIASYIIGQGIADAGKKTVVLPTIPEKKV